MHIAIGSLLLPLLSNSKSRIGSTTTAVFPSSLFCFSDKVLLAVSSLVVTCCCVCFDDFEKEEDEDDEDDEDEDEVVGELEIVVEVDNDVDGEVLAVGGANSNGGLVLFVPLTVPLPAGDCCR